MLECWVCVIYSISKIAKASCMIGQGSFNAFYLVYQACSNPHFESELSGKYDKDILGKYDKDILA